MKFNEVKALAKACKVPISAACMRAGMAASTPHRWENGSEPSDEKLAQLRAGVLLEAEHRRTLPPEYRRELPEAADLLEQAPPEVVQENPHEIVKDLQHGLKRLQRSLKASGVQTAS